MGYDLFITRGVDWFDETRELITLQEWEKYVASDSELQLHSEMGDGFAVWSGPSQLEGPWIAYSDGNLHAKNPDPQLIEKMTAVATKLGARVVGEGGEAYLPGGRVEKPAPPTRLQKIKRRLSNFFAGSPEPADAETLPFRVGDRVKDFLGRVAVVERIDTRAEHGLGVIDVRYEDGNVRSFAVVANGLEPVDDR